MNKFLVILFFFLLAGCSSAETFKKPNFIFIMVDDLGKEWIETYGATEIKTPNINQLAETGVIFNNAYSMPQCTPSRVALITGQYPYSSGWINHYDVPRWGHGVNFDADKNPSFAKALQSEGYATCIAGKWQINDFRIEPKAMEKAGFQEYCMWTGYESGNKPSENRYWDPYIFTKNGSKTYKGEFGPDIFSDFIIEFMTKNKEKPMCIYYPMVLTHSPFVHTPQEPEVKTKYQKHQAMVRYTDFIIGKIVKSMKELDILDNTYLIFTTDNGTSNGIIGKRDSVYVRGGKSFLTENGINAPFLVVTPDKKQFVSDALIDFTDIYPTLLDLAGVEDNSKSTGYSFAEVLQGKSQQSKRDWILSMGGLTAKISDNDRMENWFTFRDRVLRDEKYKVYTDTLKNIVRVFDLEVDPYETKNLIGASEVKKTIEKFENILSSLPDQDAQPKYKKTVDSLYNVPDEKLNCCGGPKGARKTNMLPLATEEAFLKLSIKN
ncbi:sulfatase-like hydrolase/transferase [Aureibaculum luteum]|uniref:sulfatase-like hydrolase/transferase n=1 Tax=Aureibaculum luteum TaxID=1548456 RepID=UPI000E53E2DC|nr:sulfatase-like hydrolase/transferase [Aureibaculum luteum]